MPNYTETLKLIKPTEDEFYNIAVPNANMDALDTYIKELQEQNQLLREELANKANKNPPQKYELELLNGFQRVNSAEFFKSENGQVTVSFKVGFGGNPIPAGKYTIAVLPEGFRPDAYIPHSVVADGANWKYFMGCWVSENGELIIQSNDDLPSGTHSAFAGTICFFAS